VPIPQVHGPIRPHMRSVRLLTLLLVVVALLSTGFGAPEQREPAAVSSPPPSRIEASSDRAPTSSGRRLDEGVSHVVAEYAPVAIDTLPLHRPGPSVDAWPSTGTPLTVVTKGTLARGQTLSEALRAQGIS